MRQLRHAPLTNEQRNFEPMIGIQFQQFSQLERTSKGIKRIGKK